MSTFVPDSYLKVLENKKVSFIIDKIIIAARTDSSYFLIKNKSAALASKVRVYLCVIFNFVARFKIMNE